MSDIPAFHFFGQRFDHVRNFFHPRVDPSACRKASQGAFVVAQILHDHAQPRQRAEMAGFARQHLPDVSERTGVVVLR